MTKNLINQEVNKMETKELRYTSLEKPDIKNVTKISLECGEFNEPEKAEAIIRNLNLHVNDTIIERSNEYIINPRMVLRGHAPSTYKRDVEALKKLLTPKELTDVNKAIKTNTKNYNKKLYDKIDKRTDKYYKDYEIREDLKEETKKYLSIFKYEDSAGLSNTLYHLLSKGNEDYLLCYREAWFNRPIPDFREWPEENDGEYLVLTESEADDRANDYLDEDQWKMAVKNGSTTSGYDDWVNEVRDGDGRGSIINGYDGSEEEETINGTTYYIYRTN
jgi:hypothetical protein